MHRHIPSAADFMNAAPYSPAPGLSYGAPQQQLGAGARGVSAPKGFSALDSFEATSFLDAGLGTEDFFSPFLNPDFPIDISLPLQHLGDNGTRKSFIFPTSFPIAYYLYRWERREGGGYDR